MTEKEQTASRRSLKRRFHMVYISGAYVLMLLLVMVLSLVNVFLENAAVQRFADTGLAIGNILGVFIGLYLLWIAVPMLSRVKAPLPHLLLLLSAFILVLNRVTVYDLFNYEVYL